MKIIEKIGIMLCCVSAWSGSLELKETGTLAFPFNTERPARILFLGEYNGMITGLAQYAFDNQVVIISQSLVSDTVVKKEMKRGQGPGEYQDISSGTIDPDNGNVFIFDQNLKRLTVFDKNLSSINSIKTIRKGLNSISLITSNEIWGYEKVFQGEDIFLITIADKATFEKKRVLLKDTSGVPYFLSQSNMFIDSNDRNSYFTMRYMEKKVIAIDKNSLNITEIPLKSDIETGLSEIPFKQSEQIDGKKINKWFQNVANRFETVVKIKDHFLVLVKKAGNTRELILFDLNGNQVASFATKRLINNLFHWNNQLYIVESIPDDTVNVYLKRIDISYE